ncbi:MAG: PH domain-containing protein [Dehalococcoidales bacterium]|nr:MAG: PH domain-containing protein [Dehalococcoidales bacterium]
MILPGMESQLIVFEDIPVYDNLNKYLISGIIAIPLIVAIVLLTQDILGAAIMFGVTVFDALLIWCILPKRFLVYEDRLKIVLGGPFSYTVPFRDITNVRQATKDMAWVYWGMRLGTSLKFQVEIERKNGLGVIISPSMVNEFIEQLNQARGNYVEPAF